MVLAGPMMAATHASSDDAKAPVETLIAEQARVDRYTDLDFARQELMYHQSSTSLAKYSGYNSYLKGDGAQANGTDLSRFKNRVVEYVPRALVDFRRTAARDRSILPEEAEMAETAEALLNDMLVAAQEIVALCEADKSCEASLVYRDKSMPLNSELTRVLCTLRTASTDRFKKTALKAKYQ